MKAYKVFDKNWCCRGFQYSLGETYVMNGEIKICKRGFHACLKLLDCFYYYKFNPENKVAEVEILGEYQTHQEDSKVVTNKIKIIKELTWYEVLDMVNTGKGNTGIGNSGDRNSGDLNSGDYNSGNWNSGDLNSGNWISGDLNSGDGNSGDRNSGDGNSGDRNNGNRNSGNWNSGNGNSGEFNTNILDKVRLFNKWISIEEYNKIKFPSWLYFDLTEWIAEQDMTDQEKNDHPEYKTTGGYLKVMEYKEAFQESYNRATKKEQKKIKKIPGFDSEIFFEISGIRIE